MFTSRTSIVVAAVALGAVSTYVTPTTIRNDVSLNRRAPNVQSNLGARGPLHTREFDDVLNTRDFEDPFELNARYFDDNELYARELYKGRLAARGDEEYDPTAPLLGPSDSGLPSGPPGASNKKGIMKTIKEIILPVRNKLTKTRYQQSNGPKAKRAEISGNWKRDLAHSLGLDANYFLKRSYQEKDFVY